MESLKDFCGRVGLILLLSWGAVVFFGAVVLVVAIGLPLLPFALLYNGVRNLILKHKTKRLWRKTLR